MRNRAHIHVPVHIGDKIADHVVSFFGTWLCLGLHTVWFALWFALSLDVALLTNIVSLEAIGLAILIMMSQVRAAAKDKKRDDLEAEEVGELYQINKRQLELLELLHTMNRRARHGSSQRKATQAQRYYRRRWGAEVPDA